MIVLSKDREPQSVADSEKSQELVAAVAIPRITPYAQAAVQADFGTDSSSKELEEEYTGFDYVRQLRVMMGTFMTLGGLLFGGLYIYSLLT